MRNLIFTIVLALVVTTLVTSCGKRDCQGARKHYNREGGFWM